MAAAHAAGRLPILSGGSGLYFASLTEGLADIPDPGPAARAEARALLEELGPAALHATSGRGGPGNRGASSPDRQPADRPRLGGVARHRHGPRGLAGSGETPAPWRFTAVLLDPPRD